ncbi:DUF3040 domain-containing protein [Pseudoglutamicibacter cumminsii]|uniref:DUF3040 domain-containing protein n=1 Tax=Pseudoglutamicibacter cumminsii TaxID=156979 RepID=UPI0026EB771B|nr:DUF3040 domain-containing protein [Pseudoglutamicibacter cumminsii]
MGLSESERRMLAEMEKQLHADPQFSSTMRRVEQTPQNKLSTRNIALGALIAFAGLGVLLLGIAMSAGLIVTVILGIVGFAIMVVGAALAMRKTEQVVTTTSPNNSSARRGDGFMARLEKEWDNRHNQG